MTAPHRLVPPILHARLIGAPPFAGRSRLSTAQARGKAYERKVVKELTRQTGEGQWPEGTLLHYGPWIEYVDKEGSGICQPDVLVVTEDCRFLFEVKLKQTAGAWDQMERLYLPLCERLWPRDRSFLVQVFKFPTCGKTARWLDRPTDLLASSRGGVYCWHYLP